VADLLLAMGQRTVKTGIEERISLTLA